MRFLLLVGLLMSVAFASVQVNITECAGINCARDCQTTSLSTKTCYEDQQGNSFDFLCLRNSSWTCFQGYAFSDKDCKHQISRNDLTCNSCFGDTMFRCNPIDRSVTQFWNCTGCTDCTESIRLPTEHCIHNPQRPGTWVMINALQPCGLTLIQTMYAGSSCSNGATGQIGFSSGFCGANPHGTSQDIVCGGTDSADSISTPAVKKGGQTALRGLIDKLV